MALQSALTSPQYDLLRNNSNAERAYSGAQLVSIKPNTLVFAARASGTQGSNSDSIARIIYYSATTGAYTDLKDGMLVLISLTNDQRAAYFRGRVRGAGSTSSVLNINQTSQTILGNSYIFVIDDYPIAERLLRVQPDGSFAADWELAYRGLLPIISGVQGAYASYVNASGKYRVTFAATAIAGQSGRTIISYLYTTPDGTVISGSLSTANVVIDFPAGFRHVQLKVTDSAGATQTLQIRVWAEPTDGTSTTLLYDCTGATINGDLTQGWTASFEAFGGVDNLLNNSEFCIWDDEVVGGTAGSIGSNVRFIGRLHREDDPATGDEIYSRIITTKFTCEGDGAQLARIFGPQLSTIYNAAASQWGDIVNWTPWRAAALMLSEFSTFMLSCPLSIPDHSDTFLFEGRNTDGQNMLNVANGLGQGVMETILMFAPWGSAEFARHAFYLSASDRNALTTVANFDNRDVLDTDLVIDHVPSTGQVDASGGNYTTVTNFVLPLRSMAPGVAKGPGTQLMTLARQLLTANVSAAAAQIELGDRAGCELERRINKATLTISMPDGYGFIIPAVNQWYTLTLTAVDLNGRAIAFNTNTRWIVTQVSYTHDNEKGTKQGSVTFAQETNGNGEGKPIIIPADDTNGLPSFTDPGDIFVPDFSLDLSGPDAFALGKGVKTLAIINSDGNVYRTTDFNTTSGAGGPTYDQASMGVTGAPAGAVGDPFSAIYALGSGSLDAWVATDTTAIYKVSDLLGTPSAVSQKAFRGTTVLRTLQMEFASQYLIVCVSVYSDGTYETHSTDGTTWSAEVRVGDATTATYQAGCAVSSRNIGKIYTSAIKSGVGAAYDSINSGSSYALLTSPAIDPGSDLCGDIHVPYNNNPSDAIAYYGKVGGSSPTSWNFLSSASPFTVSDPAGAHNPAFTGSVPGTWVLGHGFESGHISTPPSDIELYAAATGLSAVSISYFSVVLYPTVNVQFNIGLYFLQSGVWTAAPGGSFYAATAGVPITYSQSFTARPNVTGIEIYIARASNNVVTGALEVHSLDIAAAGPSGRHFEVASGATISDISPIVSGTPYGPWQSRQVDSDGSNRQLMVAALGDVTQTNAGVWVSDDGFATNSQLVAPAAAGSRYERAAISGDGNGIVYVWGTDGVIGISTDGTTVDDRSGNLSAFSPGTNIQILGGG